MLWKKTSLHASYIVATSASRNIDAPLIPVLPCISLAPYGEYIWWHGCLDLLALWWFHWSPVDSIPKGPVIRKVFPCHYVKTNDNLENIVDIMDIRIICISLSSNHHTYVSNISLKKYHKGYGLSWVVATCSIGDKIYILFVICRIVYIIIIRNLYDYVTHNVPDCFTGTEIIVRLVPNHNETHVWCGLLLAEVN